jgi:hypothetical protein
VYEAFPYWEANFPIQEIISANILNDGDYLDSIVMGLVFIEF